MAQRLNRPEWWHDNVAVCPIRQRLRRTSACDLHCSMLDRHVKKSPDVAPRKPETRRNDLGGEKLRMCPPYIVLDSTNCLAEDHR